MSTKRITKADYLELEEKYNKLQEEFNELKFRLGYYQADCDKLYRENLELEGKIDLLNKMINIRDSNIQELTNKNEELKANAPVLVHKHNERNAGRKKKVNEDIINKVISLRKEGNSIRAIVKEVGFSIGTVQKIINEFEEHK